MTTGGSDAGLWIRFLSGPDNDGARHFNVLRGQLPGPGGSGIKVVGDIAVGQLILRRAEQADVGTMLRYR